MTVIKSMIIVLMLTSTAWVMALKSSTPAATPQITSARGTTCSSAQACAAGFECRKGHCIPTKAQLQSKVAAKKSILLKKRKSKKATPQVSSAASSACSSSSQCVSGDKCIQGYCMPPCSNTGQCGSWNYEAICENGYCTPISIGSSTGSKQKIKSVIGSSKYSGSSKARSGRGQGWSVTKCSNTKPCPNNYACQSPGYCLPM